MGALSEPRVDAERVQPRATPELRVHSRIDAVAEADWDALAEGDEEATPFTTWAWLEALERSGCVGGGTGWSPRHLALYREGRLIAAAPAYVCSSSHGDFSQDWGWAEGAQRAGLRYYPKLALTVPFTPVTGRRFLVAPNEDREACTAALVDGATQLAAEERYVAAQVLFPPAAEAELLERLGWARRLSFQYHWHNEGYRDFDEYLARFSSKRRNQLKRERAAPAQQGIAVRTVRDDELGRDPAAWAEAVQRIHRTTLDKLPWGQGWLNRAFYERVLTRMARHVEVVEARRDGALIAMAFNVASSTRLYGRYWGCLEEHPFLHFNVCFYHSIEQCIARGLSRFEGGAGGEHKLSRGFEPAETHGAHLFLDARLDEAVRRHLVRENRALTASLARWRAEAPILKPRNPSER